MKLANYHIHFKYLLPHSFLTTVIDPIKGAPLAVEVYCGEAHVLCSVHDLSGAWMGSWEESIEVAQGETFSKEQLKRKALKLALFESLPYKHGKEERTKVWEAYRTSTKVPRWKVKSITQPKTETV